MPVIFSSYQCLTAMTGITQCIRKSVWIHPLIDYHIGGGFGSCCHGNPISGVPGGGGVQVLIHTVSPRWITEDYRGDQEG